MIYLQIFWVFFRISFIAFGGVIAVLPELQSWVVERGWVTKSQFFQAFILGQFVPGPNMAMCSILGYQTKGMGGWLAAFLGIYSAPVLLMGITVAIYRRWRHLRWVRRVEIGLRPLVFGVLLGAGLIIFNQEARGHLLAALVLGGLGSWGLATGRLGTLSSMFVVGIAWWGWWRLLLLVPG